MDCCSDVVYVNASTASIIAIDWTIQNLASTVLIADDPKPLILQWPIPVVCSVARTATVNASNEQTNIRTSAKSNEGGNYTNRATEGMPLFAAGSGTGFREFVAANIVLATRDELRVDAKLEVGSVDTKVEVSAGSTLIETETGLPGQPP